MQFQNYEFFKYIGYSFDFGGVVNIGINIDFFSFDIYSFYSLSFRIPRQTAI